MMVLKLHLKKKMFTDKFENKYRPIIISKLIENTNIDDIEFKFIQNKL